ncbi:MAG: PQQ-binding-like beta-propeller repeat protein, partial [Steroidobacteraceae bacterium]
MKWSAIAAALVLLAGCSHTGGKNKKTDKPMALVKITAQFQPVRAWSATLAKAEPKLRLGLAPAIDDNRVYGAGAHGEVLALDLATGRRLWQKQLKLALSGGPGAG